MKVRKSTPIFVVDAITPATLSFWEKTGWKKEIEVPHGDDVGFVLLQNDGREIMLQSRASVKADLATEGLDPTCALYNDVANLEEARAACKTAGGRIVIEERKTFYGAREMWVVDPAGILVAYAEIETV